MKNELFDFGFTTVDETELKSYHKAEAMAEKTEAVVEATQQKIDDLYNAVKPLLKNLKTNPEKEYILWPNRLAKVEEFEEFLYDIYKS